MSYHPKGNSPVLYRPGEQPVMHLDQMTFRDTVFGREKAFLVEFYSDWCGHCRAFVPIYLELTKRVKKWNEVLQVAAINCADEFNEQVCKENSIRGFPALKYFPRTARGAQDAVPLSPVHLASELMKDLLSKITNEYSSFRHRDWPNFSPLLVSSEYTYDELWAHVNPDVQYLAIIFEAHDSTGAQFLLDIHPMRSTIAARRAASNSPIAYKNQVKQFPSVLVFNRADLRPIFLSPYSEAVAEQIQLMTNKWHQKPTSTFVPMVPTTPKSIVNCDTYPDWCQNLYYVSETDILKSTRMALYDEVIKSNIIQGPDFNALYNFTELLVKHLPTTTFLNRRGTNARKILTKSSDARQIFLHLLKFLDQHKQSRSILVSTWKHQFKSAEKLYGDPFPTNASWQHCAGTNPSYRGYTCGLWTTFHAMTVNGYVNSLNGSMDPLKPLNAIRGWVGSFFGCEDCRRHFLHMTGVMFPMTGRWVREPHDMIYYLWRAHNIVNNRLHGDSTEDPQFIKRQFPAPFLCPLCYVHGRFDRRNILHFLIRYYNTIVQDGSSYIS